MLSVVKPLQEFGKLDKCLSRYGTRFEFNNEKQVIFSSDVNSEDTFVILEGVISLRREENVLIGITQAPYIMGLADGLMKNDIPYKLISEGNCTGYHLPAKQTITLIEQNQLWRDAFYWLAWQNRILLVYSTPGDMMRWMQQYLSSDFYQRSNQADRMQTLIYQRAQFTKVIGMDVPGKADALGLGWVYMAPKEGRPGIIQKTGGGGGFITYMAMIPQKNIGAFVVVTRSPLTRFKNMSDGINDLVTELSGNKPLVIPAS